jgi:hypothetical protein
MPWHAERPSGASSGAKEVGHRSSVPSGLGSEPAWLVGALAAGSRACQHLPARPPPPWTRWENEAPAARAARRPASGRLFGLFQDPAKVFRAAVDDWDGDDAGHLVGWSRCTRSMICVRRLCRVRKATRPSVFLWTWPCQRWMVRWAGSCAPTHTAGCTSRRVNSTSQSGSGAVMMTSQASSTRADVSMKPQ